MRTAFFSFSLHFLLLFLKQLCTSSQGWLLADWFHVEFIWEEYGQNGKAGCPNHFAVTCGFEPQTISVGFDYEKMQSISSKPDCPDMTHNKPASLTHKKSSSNEKKNPNKQKHKNLSSGRRPLPPPPQEKNTQTNNKNNSNINNNKDTSQGQ